MLSDELGLEKLLERLFEDDDELTLEDTVVLRGRIRLPETFSTCCTYNYAGYGG